MLTAFFEGLRVGFLERGELEDYLSDHYHRTVKYPNSQELIAKALTSLYDPSSDPLSLFPGLTALLQALKVLPQRSEVDFWVPIELLGREMVQCIQLFSANGEIRSQESALQLLGVKFKNFEKVAKLVTYEWTNESKYRGVLEFRFGGETRRLEFDEKTPVHELILRRSVR